MNLNGIEPFVSNFVSREIKSSINRRQRKNWNKASPEEKKKRLIIAAIIVGIFFLYMRNKKTFTGGSGLSDQNKVIIGVIGFVTLYYFFNKN